jgi:peptidoglycan/xylan/chitin deacetylase (PgdA/CDA1 family)
MAFRFTSASFLLFGASLGAQAMAPMSLPKAPAPPTRYPVEIHQKIDPVSFPFTTPMIGSTGSNNDPEKSDTKDTKPIKHIALTLDACGGDFDKELLDFLIERRIPATVFVTKKWLNHNAAGVALIKAHLDLFEVENHGSVHIPAVIGEGKRVYGIPGHKDADGLTREVLGGADAIEYAFHTRPTWYRGATAEYDGQSLEVITELGFKVAGFSLNADSGAKLSRDAIVSRLKGLQDGDVLIGHMNKPKSDSFEGLSKAIDLMLKDEAHPVSFVRLDQVRLVKIP